MRVVKEGGDGRHRLVQPGSCAGFLTVMHLVLTIHTPNIQHVITFNI